MKTVGATFLKPGNYFRWNRRDFKAIKVLSIGDKYVHVETDGGDALIERGEQLVLLNAEEISRHDFDPSDARRLDWLNDKILEGKIKLSGKGLPTAINLRSTIDHMMISEGEHLK